MNRLNDTTYRAISKDDWKDRIEVEVGDAKQDDFYPQIKIMRWDNEANFSVRLKDEEDGVASISEKDDKVTWDKGNFKIEFYEVETAHKFVWYLKEKPKTNKVQFTIQSKGLKFAYQPELTQKEKDEGASRPENVVGSYAVYMENPGTNWVGGKEYKVGKVGHIFRPHLYDSNGLEAWGDLHIENGKYEVTIPQDFLDKAVFPIKSNDTFGYEDLGASIDSNQPAQSLRGSKFASASGGTVTQINVWINKAPVAIDFKGVIVLASNLNIITNGVSNINSQDSSGRFNYLIGMTFSTNPTVSATDYVLTMIFNGSNPYADIYYDSGDTDQGYNDTSNNYTTPTNPTDATTNDRKYSIYATYTAAATITGPFPTFQRP